MIDVNSKWCITFLIAKYEDLEMTEIHKHPFFGGFTISKDLSITIIDMVNLSSAISIEIKIIIEILVSVSNASTI